MSSAVRKEKIEEALRLLDEAAGEAKEDIAKTVRQSAKMVTDSAKAVDESVHRNPWSYVGGTALAGMIFGFIMGRRTR